MTSLGSAGFRFHPKEGGSDYASCSGLYLCDESKGLFNNNLVFVNADKQRILVAHQGSGWTIAALHNWDILKTTSVSLCGFHSIQKGFPHTGLWKEYDVELVDRSYTFDGSQDASGKCFGNKHLFCSDCSNLY